MPTQFIDKRHAGTESSPTAIADDSTGRALIRNLATAAGFVYDSVAGLFKYNGADAVKTLVDTDTAQTLTNKSLIQPVAAYAADGAIAISPGVHALTKAGVGAYTLAAPTAAQEGTHLIIFSTTANAHVITATNLINDGVGPLLDTITFDNVAGAHIQLVAYNLLWYVVAQNATTATAGA